VGIFIIANGLILLTILVVFVPSVLASRHFFWQHTMEHFEQHNNAVKIWLREKELDLENTAMLVARHPDLIQSGINYSEEDLSLRLSIIQPGLTLDKIGYCPTESQMDNSVFCDIRYEKQQYIYDPVDASLWLISFHELLDDVTDTVFYFGYKIDPIFAEQIKSQNEIDLIFFQGVDLILSSMDTNRDMADIRNAALYPEAKEAAFKKMNLINFDFLSDRFSLGESIYYETYFSLDEYHEVNRRVLLLSSTGLLLMVLINAAVFGFWFFAIERPVVALSRKTQCLDSGIVDRPIYGEFGIKEINALVRRFEKTRADLFGLSEKLAEGEKWTQNLLESMSEGVFLIGEDQRVIYANKGAEKMFNCDRENLIGARLDQFLEPVPEGKWFSQLLPEPGEKHIIEGITVDGHEMSLAVTSANLNHFGRELGLIIRDVTEEEALHRAIGQFLANVTHEFRTPLSTLSASVELLRDEGLEMMPDETQSLYETLYLIVIKFQNLVDNLIEGASIEAGQFFVKPQNENLIQIILEIVQLLQPYVNKYEKEIITEFPEEKIWVQADTKRIGQVLTNLISNAVKHHPKGKIIRITVAEEGECIKVNVIDEGIGISEVDQSEIFKPYVRLYRGHKSVGGMGLGLTIVKAIIEAHGGQVGTDNNSSTFWFTLKKGEAL
jgi:PAS domain S-box-containing protein